MHGIPTQPLVHDPRIKAAVIADPLLGRFVTTEGLRDVHLPVQLWASAFGGDGVTPDDAATVNRNLTAKPELRTVANAGHFAFLPPCSLDQARAHAQICADAESFDRAVFHVEFDWQVVAFFRAHLVLQPWNEFSRRATAWICTNRNEFLVVVDCALVLDFADKGVA